MFIVTAPQPVSPGPFFVRGKALSPTAHGTRISRSRSAGSFHDPTRLPDEVATTTGPRWFARMRFMPHESCDRAKEWF
jgi:hypothetical protein